MALSIRDRRDLEQIPVYFLFDIRICQAKMTVTNGAVTNHHQATDRIGGDECRQHLSPHTTATLFNCPLRRLHQMANLTPEQAKEFHEQFKITYTAFVGIAAVAHLLVFASKPWF